MNKEIVEIPHIDGVTINVLRKDFEKKLKEYGENAIKTRQYFQRENTSPEYIC